MPDYSSSLPSYVYTFLSLALSSNVQITFPPPFTHFPQFSPLFCPFFFITVSMNGPVSSLSLALQQAAMLKGKQELKTIRNDYAVGCLK